MPNNSTLSVLIIREPQVLVLQKINPIIKINYINTRNYYIRFSKGLAII
jgi:hypothetical protein